MVDSETATVGFSSYLPGVMELDGRFGGLPGGLRAESQGTGSGGSGGPGKTDSMSVPGSPEKGKQPERPTGPASPKTEPKPK